MKFLVMALMGLMAVSAQAETVKMEFAVQSITNHDFDVQIMVMGVDNSKVEEIGQVIVETITLTASQYSKYGFLDSRSFAIARLERNLKKKHLTFDGIGILGLVKKDGQIQDVE